MKKAISLVLALVLMVMCIVPAFAEEATTGTINLCNVAVQEVSEDTYKPIADYVVYKMFDLVGYNTASQQYTYTVTAEWADFVRKADPDNGVEAGKGTQWYEMVETAGGGHYIKWVGDESAERKEAAGKAALEYAKSKTGITKIENYTVANPQPDTSGNGNTTATLVFDNLSLGYYLVDSTMGVLCGLTTTNTSVDLAAKNAPPTLTKLVQENSPASGSTGTGSAWDTTNDATIDETVYFDTTITVHKGAQQYTLHDSMAEGLTFQQIDSITLVLSAGGSRVIYGNPDPKDDVGDAFTVLTGDKTGDSDCDFEVVFTEDFCNGLKTGDKIVILYSAKLNEKARIGKDVGNVNSAWVTYGENGKHATEPKTTVTYTYAFDLLKVDSQRTLLEGAKFKLYATENSTTPIKLVASTGNGKETYDYRVATTTDGVVEAGAIEEFEVANGRLRIAGLDSGTYYLEETKAPAGGYNPLEERQSFTIDSNNIDANIMSDGKPQQGSGVQVVNNSGTILPGTGGLGTLLFTVLGGSTVLGSGVVLVTKKRMSKIVDED